MHWKVAWRIIGQILCGIGLCMSVPLVFGLWRGDGSACPFFLSMCLTILIGLGLTLLFRRTGRMTVNHRDSMIIVSLCWVACAACGALPFVLGGFASFTDAFFESMSGFTTTGASILTDVEALPKSILLWRSLTHWLGGMGIVVLTIAILPFLGVGGMQLYKAEVPGPVTDKLQPRIRDTARILWEVYVGFTAVYTVLLLWGGMDLFESLCHSFATMATGGFSVRNASIGAYRSAYVDYGTAIFMILASINFSMHFQFFRGRPLIVWRDPELRFFLAFVLLATLIVTGAVHGTDYTDWKDALRFAFFQVASMVSTTGYVTADYEFWPPVAQGVLLLCMFMGGCAGSTAGGIKCMRIMILLRHAYQELFRLVHPRAVVPVKFGTRMVRDDVLGSVWGFVVLFLTCFILAGLLLAALGMDVVTAFSSVVACLSNVGPGFGQVGPMDNYSVLPAPGKWVLSLCMLLGRLEIHTVLVLFLPEFWRK